MSYLRDVFLTIAFQFEPSTAYPTTTTSYATTTSTCMSATPICTTRDLLVFAISSNATYCELDLCT